MPWTTASLTADFARLGIAPGDSVLVHSSFKSLGPGEADANRVIDALLAAVGPEGTLLVPTHTWAGASPATPPTFDVRTTPSARIGIIPELARQRPGGLRGVHPTHSVVAFGPLAEWFVGNQFDSGLVGPGSPYDLLATPPSGNGLILLLGVDHERNTSLHLGEELMNVPGALTEPAVCQVTDHQGITHPRESRFHVDCQRRFMVLDEPFDTLGIQRKGQVAAAPCRLVHAAKQREYVLKLLGENPVALWA